MSALFDRLGGNNTPFWASSVLLIVLTATGTLLLTRSIGPDGMDLAAERERADPDVRMERALLRQFDDAGELQFELQSSDIRFFRDPGRAELTMPDLTLFDDDQTAWQVRAVRGSLHGEAVGSAGEDEVRLQEDVVLQPRQGPRRGRLVTQSLTLYPDRQYATTDQAVIIDGEGGRTAAAGLEGDLQGGVLKLFSSAEQPVQTILLPGQFK